MTIDALQQGMNFSQFRVILGQALDHSTRRGGIAEAGSNRSSGSAEASLQTRGNGGRVTLLPSSRKPPDR
jgi:hypothetical protein